MATSVVRCPACGQQVASAPFCSGCGGPLMPASVADGVRIVKGDVGIDRSHTDVDNSRHTTIHRDSHDVKTDVRVDNSQRNVTVQVGNGDDRTSNAWWGWVLGGGLALLTALVPVFWPVAPPTQPPPSVVVNVPVTVGAPQGESRVQEGPRSTSTPPSVAAESPAVVQQSGAGRRGAPVSVPPSAPAMSAPPLIVATDPETDRARYVNRGVVRSGSTYVLIVDSRTGIDVMLTQQVGALVGGTDDLFKPAFVREGLFSRVHQGDTDALSNLVDSAVGRVILGTRVSTFAPTQVAGQALVRAAVTLNARIIEPSRGFVSTLASASDIGAGFDEQSALTLATENALKKLSRQLGR